MPHSARESEFPNNNFFLFFNLKLGFLDVRLDVLENIFPFLVEGYASLNYPTTYGICQGHRSKFSTLIHQKINKPFTSQILLFI